MHSTTTFTLNKLSLIKSECGTVSRCGQVFCRCALGLAPNLYEVVYVPQISLYTFTFQVLFTSGCLLWCSVP